MKAIRTLLLLLFCALAPVVSAFGQGTKVLGYYPEWAKWTYPASGIPYENLTHIAHSFIWPAADGSLVVGGTFLYPDLITTAHANGVKVVVALGGWGEAPTAGFQAMAQNTEARARFIQNIVAFVKQHGYDGIDLDWEYPKPADRVAFVRLVKELRAALTAENPEYTLSAAVPSSDWSNAYDVPGFRDDLSWIGVMTYDYHGSWTPHAGHNAPLFRNPKDADGSTDESVRSWASKGMPKGKILPGIPFYGRRFNAANMFAAGSGGGSATYAEAETMIAQGWTYTWDDVSKVPYLQNPGKTEVVTFEDTTSARIKSEYVRSQGYGGVIIWALQQGVARDRSQPLLATIASVLQPNAVGRGEDEPLRDTGDRLGAPYPNPAAEQTTVPFYLAAAGPVRLEAYDLLGARVATLVDGSRPAGPHEVIWRAEGVSAGAYWLVLRSRSELDQKMVVVTP